MEYQTARPTRIKKEKSIVWAALRIPACRPCATDAAVTPSRPESHPLDPRNVRRGRTPDHRLLVVRAAPPPSRTSRTETQV